MDTSDTGWSNCREVWERLAWARARAGFTQTSFAETIGMKRTAYLKYEASPESSSGNTALKLDQARRWGQKLKVRWEWLMDNEGTPWLEERRPADKVRQALAGLMPDEEIEHIAQMTDLLDRRRSGTEG